jgi:hypothetical protein
MRVVCFDRPHRLEGLLQNFPQLSGLVGPSDQGKEIVAGMRAALSKEGFVAFMV